MTDVEKAEEFAGLLSHWPSVLTICTTRECGLKPHIREQYPDMITLEWWLNLPNLAIDERGVSAMLAFGDTYESVFVPWAAIIDVRVASTAPAPEPAPPTRLRLIKGGRGPS